MLAQTRIILVNPTHQGNIGSTARAMKTMGMNQLYIISTQNQLSDHAFAMAAGAKDVLHHAQFRTQLSDAIHDCNIVVGTSARSRSMQIQSIDVRECAYKITHHAQPNEKIALIFGTESSGLTNEQLNLCHYHCFIHANPQYPILNLAAAVQIVAYEFFQAYLAHYNMNDKPTKNKEAIYPTQQALNKFKQQVVHLLTQIHFLKPNHNGNALNKLHCLFNRSKPTIKELSLLQNILGLLVRTMNKKKFDKIDNSKE